MSDENLKLSPTGISFTGVSVKLPTFGDQKFSGGTAVLNLLRDLSRYFQENYCQYIVVANNFKKDIGKITNKTRLKPKELDDLNTLFLDYGDFLHTGCYWACQESVKLLERYFKGRSKIEPRVCVKSTNRENRIVDFYRKGKNPCGEGEGFLVNENTGFESCFDKQKEFLCNNIPEQVLLNKYKNKRIDGESVRRNYKEPQKSFLKTWFSRDPYFADPNWDDYWDRGLNPSPPDDTHYRSTLIIPISLANACLGKKYREIREWPSLGEVDSGSLVYGFICCDHQGIKFFRDLDDINIGFTFANLLTLYFHTLRNLTRYSSIYDEARFLLQKNGLLTK